LAGIYIHIPFCRQACHYCNFHFSTSLRKKDALLQAIAGEIEIVQGDKTSSPGRGALQTDETIETIYFGGGTPSILEGKEIDQLLQKIFSSFNVADDAEITLEVNPDDIKDEKLQTWRESGITRLSIGVQSFFEDDLRWMNRAHNAKQAIDHLKQAQNYFDSITIDLIYGVPGLTNDRWHKNVQMAIDLGIPHLSCYALTVEPKTPLDKLIRTSKKQGVQQDQQSEQFLLLMDWLHEADYEHYEISNFAKQGFRSRHNSSYWQGKGYFGFGPGAHSFNGTERQWNVANNQKYIDAIAQGIIPFGKEVLTDTQKANEYIMISLRTIEGIDLRKLCEADRSIVSKATHKYVQQGLLINANDHLKLTKHGKLFADGIAADLFLD